MPIPRQGPVDFEAVRAELGESEADDVALCTSAKINRKAKYKPYRIDTFRDITDTDRTGMHVQLTAAEGGGTVKAPYGLVPRGFAANGGYGAMTMLPWLDKWANDCKPRAGVDWCRITDFAGYNQKAGSYVHALLLYTDNPRSNRVPMGPTKASDPTGHIYADITLSSMEGGLALYDFDTLKPLYLTLLFGCSEGSDPFCGMVYADQYGPVSAMTDYSGTVRLQINIDRLKYNDIINNPDAPEPWNVAIACLAPKLTINSSTQEVSGGIDYSKLVSLDMWGDGFQSVMFSANIDKATWGDPVPGVFVFVGGAATPFALSPSGIRYESSRRALWLEYSERLPDISLSVPPTGATLSNVTLWLAVQMGSNLYVREIEHRSCYIDGSKLHYDTDPIDNKYVSIPSSVPAGTYATKVALMISASGVLHQSTSSGNTAKNCVLTDSNLDNSDTNYEPWYGADSLPINAIATVSVSLGNITIS